MRQEGGALPYLRPYTPEHVRAIELSRKQANDTLVEKPKLEIPPTNTEIEAYIREHHLETHEERLKHEQELAKQLSDAVYRDNEEQIDRLRRQIWIVSSAIQNSTDLSYKQIDIQLKNLIESKEEAPINYYDGNDTMEQMEIRDAEIETLHLLRGALLRQLTGQELINSLKSQEDNHSSENNPHNPLADFEYHYLLLLKKATDYRAHLKKDAEPEIKALRPIRDRLYFSILFPNLAKSRQRSEHKHPRR